jgi:hypothetical protein
MICPIARSIAPSVCAALAFTSMIVACSDDPGGSTGSGGAGGSASTSTTATSAETTTATTSTGGGTGGAGGMPGTGGMGNAGGMGGTGGTGGVGGMGGAGGSGGGTAIACFDGGTAIGATTAAGNCTQPIAINLSGASVGAVSTYTVPGTMGAQSARSWTEGSSCGVTGFDASTRYVVFSVDVGTATALEVSVDAAAGANPLVGVAEDPSCQQPLNACADDGALGECEFVRAEKGGFGFFGTSTYVIVSDGAASSAEMTVRFRLGAP